MMKFIWIKISLQYEYFLIHYYLYETKETTGTNYLFCIIS